MLSYRKHFGGLQALQQSAVVRVAETELYRYFQLSLNMFDPFRLAAWSWAPSQFAGEQPTKSSPTQEPGSVTVSAVGLPELCANALHAAYSVLLMVCSMQ